MRVLQLTPRSPYPPIDGGRVAMLAILRGLAGAGCHVELISLNQQRLPVDDRAARAALAPAPVILVPHDTDDVASTLIASLTHLTSPPIARFVSPAMERIVIERLRRGDIDIVHIEGIFLSWLIPTIRKHSRAAVVMRTQNIEHPIVEQVAVAEPRVGRRLLLRAMASMLAHGEAAAWNSCDALVPISAEDAQESRRLGCHVPIHVMPAGVDLPDVPSSGDRHIAWFLGSLDYKPNQQAALWIAREIAPRVAAIAPELSIEIAGSNPPDDIVDALAKAGIVLHRDVADAAAFANARGVALAPVFSGGGMRIKILQAMASGNPVVATTVAASGMNVVDGEHLLLVDDADGFAAAIVRLARDVDLSAQLVERARTLVASQYDNAKLGEELSEFYRRLVNGSRTSPRTARA